MDSENKKGASNKVLSGKNYIPIMLVVCAGLILSLFGFIGTRALEYHEIKTLFNYAAEERSVAIEKAVNDRMLLLETIRSFYDASNFVSREEFSIFIRPFLGQVKGIQALEWVPRVLETERAKYEEDARKEGMQDFKITEKTDQGHMAPVKRRGEYFPVYFVEPYQGNEAAVGFDLASNPKRLAALNKARDTGRNIATERIMLVQEKRERYGFLIFLPVFKKGMPVNTIEEHRKNLAGFVLGVFRVGDVVEAALTSLQPKYIDIYLYDKEAAKDNSFLYYHRSRSRKNVSKPDEENKDNYIKGLKYTKTIEVGGRQWEIRCVAPPGFVATKRTWHPWGVLIAGLIITGILARYFFVHISRTASIKRLVLQRTGQLQASEARIHAILDTAPNAIITIREDGIIESFNPAAERMFGYAASEAIGRDIETLLPGLSSNKQNTSDSNAQIKRFIGGGRELVAQRKDDTIFPVYLSMGEVILEDRKIFTAIVHDITQRKQDELELRGAREAAELANRAKSDFLANMSHEIRTPMSGVIGMADLLSDTELTPEQREYIETITSSGETLLRIINDILDFSKVEAGQITLENTPFDIRDVLKKTADTTGHLAQDKGLELIWEIEPDVTTQLIGDPFRLRQILVNLVNNAIKFTNKGKIAVKVQVLKQKEKCVLKFSVRDTGIGLSLKQQKNIFNPFAQADTSTSRRYGGTGLGLSIVKRLVEMMAGQIWVESPATGPVFPDAGPGSIFYFTLALGRAPEALVRADREKKTVISKAPVKSLEVILAEDNKINQKVASTMLTKRGHKVTIAENGEEVLSLIAQKSFDVILMDIQMPRMDGFEATRRIREKEKDTNEHIPIVAMTAHALKGDREKCLEAGMDGYVSKPVKKEDLFKAIEQGE